MRLSSPSTEWKIRTGNDHPLPSPIRGKRVHRKNYASIIDNRNRSGGSIRQLFGLTIGATETDAVTPSGDRGTNYTALWVQNPCLVQFASAPRSSVCGCASANRGASVPSSLVGRFVVGGSRLSALPRGPGSSAPLYTKHGFCIIRPPQRTPRRLTTWRVALSPQCRPYVTRTPCRFSVSVPSRHGSSLQNDRFVQFGPKKKSNHKWLLFTIELNKTKAFCIIASVVFPIIRTLTFCI